MIGAVHIMSPLAISPAPCLTGLALPGLISQATQTERRIFRKPKLLYILLNSITFYYILLHLIARYHTSAARRRPQSTIQRHHHWRKIYPFLPLSTFCAFALRELSIFVNVSNPQPFDPAAFKYSPVRLAYIANCRRAGLCSSTIAVDKADLPAFCDSLAILNSRAGNWNKLEAVWEIEVDRPKPGQAECRIADSSLGPETRTGWKPQQRLESRAGNQDRLEAAAEIEVAGRKPGQAG